MDRLLRWLMPSRSSWISREEALHIAGSAAGDRGLAWIDPIRAFRHFGDWSIRSAANMRGGNVMVIVDGASDEVKLVSGPAPR